ncbi:hypothetical protein ONZ51_g4829 [Trametes cubensis]|uniref:Uncharacterized protein n=1 Tax=Trametes cubensis TaxID=1111947 RepID=A0AAD7XCM1_9APHY|nr:hypothetical protein ONZ51_g4829 [Trametes cubensis]
MDLIKLFGSSPIANIIITAPNTDRWTIITVGDWEHMLQSFPLLRRLGVIFHPVQQLPHSHGDDPLMTLLSALSSSQGDAGGVCPELACLTLHSSDVDLDADAGRTMRLVDCLRVRKTRGRAVSQLRILLERDSSYYASDVAPTRKEHALLQRYQSVFGPGGLVIVAPNPDLWKTLDGADWADLLRSFPHLKSLSVLFHPSDKPPRVGQDNPLESLLAALDLHASDLEPDASDPARMSRVVDCLRGRDDQDYPVIVLRILFELDSDSALNIEFAAREQMARFEGAFEPSDDSRSSSAEGNEQ